MSKLAIKERNFPYDFIYKHRRVFTGAGFSLYVFYDFFSSEQKQILLDIFKGKRTRFFISDVNGWRTFIAKERPSPIGFQLFWCNKAIVASKKNGVLTWSYQYYDGGFGNTVANNIDSDIVTRFTDATMSLDKEIIDFVKSILETRVKVLTTSEKASQNEKDERWNMSQSPSLGPLFRGKKEEDE